MTLEFSDGLPPRSLESVPAGITEVSPQGAILFAKSVATAFLGLCYDELSRMYVTDFDHNVFYEDGRECPVSEYPVSKCLATGLPQRAALLGARLHIESAAGSGTHLTAEFPVNEKVFHEQNDPATR